MHETKISFEDLNFSVLFQVLDPAALAAVQKPMTQKRESGPIRVKDADENAGPTTTVFVGNISEKASDMLVRQLLAVSGRSVHRLYSTITWSTFNGFNVCLSLSLFFFFLSCIVLEVWHCSELETGAGCLW